MTTANKFEFINLSYLSEAAMGSNEFMIEMIDAFLEDAPKTLEKIKNYYEERYMPGLKSEAHKFKPNLAIMGISSLTDAIKQLEHLAVTDGSHSEIGAIVEKIEQTTLSALEELNQAKQEIQ